LSYRAARGAIRSRVIRAARSTTSASTVAESTAAQLMDERAGNAARRDVTERCNVKTSMAMRSPRLGDWRI